MLRKSVRTLLALSLLSALLVTGPVHLSARSSSAADRSRIPLGWGGFVPLSTGAKGPAGQQLISQISRTATSHAQFTADPSPSLGRAPKAPGPAGGSTDSPLSPLAVNAAFAVQLTPDERMRYILDIDTPGDWINVGSTAGTSYLAGDFVGRDYTQLYVIDFYLNELHTLNTATGADTTIGTSNPLPGQQWTGATGTADGTLYASSTDAVNSYLYTVNIGTGTTTVVGEITNAPAIIDIAINADGEMYGVDIDLDSLIQIDPLTGAGTVIGPIGFAADYAQGMDFEEVSGVLYLAAYNTDTSRGELRIANTATGSSSLVDAFPDDAETDALAFTPPLTQLLKNPGFENGWAYWFGEGSPFLSDTSHSGSWSVYMFGEECWVLQEVYIPPDTMGVNFGYWASGQSSDPDWDNDILIGGIWDLSRQTKYVDVRTGLTYFYHNPGVWRDRIYRLDAEELANVVGQWVLVGFQLTQDWNPGYHKTSSAWVDDVVLYVTRPIYDYSVYLPVVVR